MKGKREDAGEGERRWSVKKNKKRGVVAVAIDRPVIKNQLTPQLPCESEPIKCA